MHIIIQNLEQIGLPGIVKSKNQRTIVVSIKIALIGGAPAPSVSASEPASNSIANPLIRSELPAASLIAARIISRCRILDSITTARRPPRAP